MNIRKHTYYKPRPNLIWYQLEDGLKFYTLHIKNPVIRPKLSEDGLHLKSKNPKKRFFRVYNNFYIRLVQHSLHSFTTTYNII